MINRLQGLSPKHFIVVALIAVPVLAGCGGTVIDAYKAQAAILAEVEIKTDTKIASVKCPTDVEVIPGAEFSCVVTARDGAEATADLRILNDEADVDIVSLSKL